MRFTPTDEEILATIGAEGPCQTYRLAQRLSVSSGEMRAFLYALEIRGKVQRHRHSANNSIMWELA